VATTFDPHADGPRLVRAIEVVARCESPRDMLNQLVISGGLDSRQVDLLRAYRGYWRQCGVPMSEIELADPLLSYPAVARSLIAYFEALFDPDRALAHPSDGDGSSSGTAAATPESVERARCEAELQRVAHLQQDRVLRGYLGLVDATLRTNYFVLDPAGRHRPVLALKLDSSRVPEQKSPHPVFEIAVHGPQVAGVHLRAGRIARGGIRFSDRPDDFRTEVLELMLAQVKKNAVIVPTGAKGGFVLSASPGGAEAGNGSTGLQVPSGPARAIEISAAYAQFIRGLLDVTDNLVGGTVVPPTSVVARDRGDPYLVVAADKGTATFSDLANSIAEEYGFWLDDAFASGGSSGYDHKAMGITARGAWVAVTRHFRQLGIDVQKDPIKVAGVGDMSGDVFGNGMLSSPTIRLVAAFDHRHVFIDPDPDPATSFAERRRLASLPRSTWADYDPALISDGGGVWSRDAKSVLLSAAAQRVLGLGSRHEIGNDAPGSREIGNDAPGSRGLGNDAPGSRGLGSDAPGSRGLGSKAMSPPEIVRSILSAPVDLLWFGGIGTFVKDATEPDVVVADRADDEVRVVADDLAARVVAEGANLAMTQRARIRFSRRGGRVNTDFIDNAAGVATSDREVNLKILLSLAIQEGRLDRPGRDIQLHRAEDEVAGAVLRQVDHSVAALDRAVLASAGELDAYEALIERLESSGRLDREVESLPTSEELAIRRQAGAGLARPELAVLLAYAKSELVEAIEASSLVTDPAVLPAVEPYFPAGIRETFGDLVPRHPLYAQLAATNVAGQIVDHLGIVWAQETAAELGSRLDEVASAFWVAHEVLGAAERWDELDSLAGTLPAEAEAALHAEVRQSVAKLARAHLTGPRGAEGEHESAQVLGAVISRDRSLADELARTSSGEPSAPAATMEELAKLGVDRETAARFVTTSAAAQVAGTGPTASASGRSVADAAKAMELVKGMSGLDRVAAALGEVLATVPPPDRFRTWQVRSLTDDIEAWCRTAASSVLSVGGPPEAAAAKWSDDHRTLLARCSDLLTALDVGQATDPVAIASLVLSRLRRSP
jgi:glutamate dehydrogenase